MSEPASTRRWLGGAGVYGCLLLVVWLAPIPGGATIIRLLVAWVALGFVVRSYAAILLVLVIPLWDGIRGTSSGDMGKDWKLELMFVCPIGALLVAAGVLAGRRSAPTPLR